MLVRRRPSRVADLPFRVSYDVVADTAALAPLRADLAVVLREWEVGDGDGLVVVVVVVNELVAAAATAATGETIELEIARRGAEITATVTIAPIDGRPLRFDELRAAVIAAIGGETRQQVLAEDHQISVVLDAARPIT